MSYRPPFYKRFPRDYRSSPTTRRMTLAEHGVYNILLDTAWEEEPTATIPMNSNALAKITGIRKSILETFLAKYPQLWCNFDANLQQSSCDFASTSRRLVNPRLRAEYEDFLEQCEKKRLAGIASGKARQEKRTPVQQTLNNTDSDTDTDKREKQKPLAAKPAAPADARFQPFYDSAFESYLQKHGQRPSWSGKDRKQLKTLLRATAVPVVELERRWQSYLASTEAFTVKQGDSLAYFCAKFDTFINGPICGPKEKVSADDAIAISLKNSGLDETGRLKATPN